MSRQSKDFTQDDEDMLEVRDRANTHKDLFYSCLRELQRSKNINDADGVLRAIERNLQLHNKFVELSKDYPKVLPVVLPIFEEIREHIVSIKNYLESKEELVNHFRTKTVLLLAEPYCKFKNPRNQKEKRIKKSKPGTIIDKLMSIKTEDYTLEELMTMVGYTKTRDKFMSFFHRNNLPYKKILPYAERIRKLGDVSCLTIEEIGQIIGYVGDRDDLRGMVRKLGLEYRRVNNSFANQLRNLPNPQNLTLKEMAEKVGYSGDLKNIMKMCNKHRVPYKKEETTVDKLIAMKDSHKYTRKELMAMVEYKGTEGSFQELIVKYKIPYLTYAQLTLPNQIRRLGDTSQLTIEEIKNLLGYKGDIRNLKAHCAMQKIPYKRLKWARL